MNKRIMTIDELYLFCIKNNFTKFNSDETNSELVVEMPGLFEKKNNTSERHTEGMTPFVSRAFHDKVNLNKSKIETEVFEDNLPSSHLRPILAHITRDEETNELDFGSHDFHIETVIEKDENGNEIKIEKTIYDEQPIGVIDGSRNVIEYDEEAKVNRAVLHGYLYNDYCQDAIDILNRRGTVDCSVELSIRSMSFDGNEKVLVLDDFYVSALTLLSAKVNPGMAGSNFKIEDFAIKNSSTKFDKDEKLIEILEKLDKTLTNFNIDGSKESEETYGKEEIVVENQEILVNEEVTETEEIITNSEETVEEAVEVTEVESTEEVTETEEVEDPVEDETPEVVEEESEEIIDEEVEEEFTEKSVEETTEILYELIEKSFEVEGRKFNVSFELSHDDIRYGLYNLIVSYEEMDNEWYYIRSVYDNKFVFQGCFSGKIYGQAYTKDGDMVALDGERYELFEELLTASEKAELESMRSNYALLAQFKQDTENAQLKAQREAILYDEKYSVIAEKDENNAYKNEAYAKLVSEMDNYSLADLEKELKSVFADYITNGGQFAYTGEREVKTVVSKKLFATSTGKKTSRYGNLFNK